MLNPKLYLKEDLDDLIRFFDFYNYYIDQSRVALSNDRFFEAIEHLQKSIKILREIRNLRHRKIIFDLKEDDQEPEQGLVDEYMRRRK